MRQHLSTENSREFSKSRKGALRLLVLWKRTKFRLGDVRFLRASGGSSWCSPKGRDGERSHAVWKSREVNGFFCATWVSPTHLNHSKRKSEDMPRARRRGVYTVVRTVLCTECFIKCCLCQVFSAYSHGLSVRVTSDILSLLSA